jgi:hypothetical protein
VGTPRWRSAFNAVERRIGEPLESAVATREFAGLLGLAARLQRTTSRTVEQSLSWWLHQWGMPSRTDIREVSRAVTRVERQLRDLSRDLEDRQEAADVE